LFALGAWGNALINESNIKQRQWFPCKSSERVPLLFLAELIKNALPNNLTNPSVRLSVKKLRNESSSWLAIVSGNLYQRVFLFSALP
jgi:hypothetical protein